MERLLHCCLDAGLFERSGVGFTVTTTSYEGPVQPSAVATTWYVTVPAEFPLLDKSCLIRFPDPGEDPVIFGELAVAVQVKLGLTPIEVRTILQ